MSYTQINIHNGFLGNILYVTKLLQAKKMREEYGKLNKVKMSIWECCEMLDKIVDVSDPDLEESQIQHALQTAETVRKDCLNEY